MATTGTRKKATARRTRKTTTRKPRTTATKRTRRTIEPLDATALETIKKMVGAAFTESEEVLITEGGIGMLGANHKTVTSERSGITKMTKRFRLEERHQVVITVAWK